MVFKIHDFESLEKKKYFTSAVACHGHQWQIVIHPWGATENAKKKEKVSVYLTKVKPTK